MAERINITLDTTDVLQMIDGLSDRADAWEKTAAHLRGNSPTDELFIAEECSDANEAASISQHYRDIVRKLEDRF